MGSKANRRLITGCQNQDYVKVNAAIKNGVDNIPDGLRIIMYRNEENIPIFMLLLNRVSDTDLTNLFARSLHRKTNTMPSLLYERIVRSNRTAKLFDELSNNRFNFRISDNNLQWVLDKNVFEIDEIAILICKKEPNALQLQYLIDRGANNFDKYLCYVCDHLYKYRDVITLLVNKGAKYCKFHQRSAEECIQNRGAN